MKRLIHAICNPDGPELTPLHIRDHTYSKIASAPRVSDLIADAILFYAPVRMLIPELSIHRLVQGTPWRR